MQDVFINYKFCTGGIYMYLILPVVHFRWNLHAPHLADIFSGT